MSVAFTILAGILAAATSTSALPVVQQRDAGDISLLTPDADLIDLSQPSGMQLTELIGSGSALQCTGTFADCSCGANFPSDFGSHVYKVNDFSQSCAHINNAVPQCMTRFHACDLYASATSGSSMAVPGFTDHAALASSHAKWVVVPKFPVTGVEDTNRREHTWDAAWSVRPGVANKLSQIVPAWTDTTSTLKTLGVAINPATSRSRHQMHLHVGKVKLDLRRQLLGKFTTLTKLAPVQNFDVWAVFVPSHNNPDMVFATASALMQPIAAAKGRPDYNNAAHHSITIVPAEDGQAGYYLVLGWDVHMEALVCGDDSALTSDPQCAYFWQ